MYFVRNDSMAFLFLDPKWKYFFSALTPAMGCTLQE